MSYTNCLNFCDIDYLDLFDDIPFKYAKSIINQNRNKDEWIDFDFQVEIEDLECDRDTWASIKITFNLEIDVSGGSLPLMVTKKYEVIKEYNTSSPMAMYIGENLIDEEEETDEEEEEDKDEDGFDIIWCEDCGEVRVYDKHYCEKCEKEEEDETTKVIVHDIMNDMIDKIVLKAEEEEDDEEEDNPLCRDCEIETKKHCDVCGGYGSNSDFETDDEEE